MLLANPHARRVPYPPDLQQVMNIAQARAGRRSLAHWDLLAPGQTPVWALPHLARELGIGGMAVKDESARSPLGSFKVLGAPLALLRLIQRRSPCTRRRGSHWPTAGRWSPTPRTRATRRFRAT